MGAIGGVAPRGGNIFAPIEGVTYFNIFHLIAYRTHLLVNRIITENIVGGHDKKGSNE